MESTTITPGAIVADTEKLEAQLIEVPTIEELLHSAEIDLMGEVEKPPICLSFDDAAVFYLGDISTIIGKAKSRKTFTSGLLMAALTGNTTMQGRISANLPSDKNVVLSFDTEQGAYHAHKAAKRVLRLLNVDYLPNFKAYGLRKYTTAQRLEMIEHAVYNTPNLGFVLIDGIRDIVTSINDEEQATAITGKLLKWSEEKQIHILCALHMNKGDNNARGHLGTELMNKSLTVLGVTKNDKQEDYSTIEAVACRDKEPKPLTFGIDADGLPYLLDGEQMELLQKQSESKTKKVLTPDQFNPDTHKANLQYHVFKNQSKQGYSEIINNIKLTYSIGDNNAVLYLTYFQNEKFIEKTKEGRPKYILSV